MSLNTEQQQALEGLLAMVKSDRPLFDPTLGPLTVDPLAAIGRPSLEVREYILTRGFSAETAGRIIGALELYYTFVAGGVIRDRPYDMPA